MISILSRYSAILIYLFPIFLITGPFLSDLSLSLVSLMFLIIVWKKKSFEIFNNKYFKIFSIFFIYILIRSLFTQEWISIKSAFFFFRFALFACAIFFFLSTKNLCLKKILISLLFCLILLFIDSLVQYFLGYNILGMKMAHAQRVSSFFGNELVMGGYAVRVLLVAIPLLTFFKIMQEYILLAIIFLFTIILLSSERTAAILMSLFAISYYTFVPLNKKIKFFFISIIISFITIFFYIAPESKQRLVNNLRSSTANFSALPQVHRDHYMTGLNMFRDNYLFGQGPKMFRVSCKNEKFIYGPHGCSTHPHSIVIQFLAELGMVGLSFLMFFYYCIFKNIVNYIFTKKNKNFYVFLLSINMLINFFPLLPYGNFFNNWLSMCSWFCIPIFMFLNNIKIK